MISVGVSGARKGGIPLTGARKSPVSDGLTNAASGIGVAHQVLTGPEPGEGGPGR